MLLQGPIGRSEDQGDEITYSGDQGGIEFTSVGSSGGSEQLSQLLEELDAELSIDHLEVSLEDEEVVEGHKRILPIVESISGPLFAHTIPSRPAGDPCPTAKSTCFQLIYRIFLLKINQGSIDNRCNYF